MKALILKWDMPNNEYIGHVYEEQHQADNMDFGSAIMTVWTHRSTPAESQKVKEYINCYFNAANITCKNLHNMVEP